MIWNRSVFAVASLIVVVSIAGCGTIEHYTEKLSELGRKKDKVENNAPQEIVIGVIEMVNPEQRFVLIRNESAFGINAGTALETRTASSTKTKLVVTPEKKLNFVSADIAEGYPQRGETVVLPVQQPIAAASIAKRNPDLAPKNLPKPATQAPPNEPIPGVPPVNQ